MGSDATGCYAGMVLPYWLAMLALLAALLHAVRRGDERRRWLLKPAAAAVFIAAAHGSGALETAWGCALFGGLLLAAAGDVLLIPKGRGAFLAGLVSFLLGHVAYGTAFVLFGVDWVWAAAAGAVLVVAAVPVVRWLWPHVAAPLRVPVAAYVAVITLMVALAAGTGEPWLAAGAAGFYLSDLSVARDRFLGASFSNRAWGVPLYFCSQLVLATAPAMVPW